MNFEKTQTITFDYFIDKNDGYLTARQKSSRGRERVKPLYTEEDLINMIEPKLIFLVTEMIISGKIWSIVENNLQELQQIAMPRGYFRGVIFFDYFS